MKQRVWVVAGNVNEYNNYVREKRLNSDKKYQYVYDAMVLRGYSNPHGVFIGTWKHRDDIIQILDQLIISTVDKTDKLHKIRTDLIRNATPAAAHSAQVSRAAQMLSDAIDAEVLQKMTQPYSWSESNVPDFEDIIQTWKGFVK